jgi:LuxR family maltose regulon positive regulatory protein
MTALLKVSAKRRPAPAHLHRLLEGAAGPAPRGASGNQGLIEPLSERELEVLRLLQSELDGPEMARELVVSLNTLRSHTKNIYAKLGVTSRRAAVRRATELDLL